MEGGWSGDDDDDGDDLPSPEAKSASRLALPKKNRGWRRLRDGNWENDFCSGISPSRDKIRVEVGQQRRWGPPRRPPGAARGWAAPPGRLGPPWLPSGPSSGTGFLRVRGFSVIFLGIF